MKNIYRKLALVTGGGMGKLWCEHLAADGARVVIWDVNQAAMDDTATALKKKNVDVSTALVDVRDAAAVIKAADELLARYGDLDLLINNAGVVFAGRYEELPLEKMNTILDVNLKGIMWTLKAFLPNMIRRNFGHIV